MGLRRGEINDSIIHTQTLRGQRMFKESGRQAGGPRARTQLGVSISTVKLVKSTRLSREKRQSEKRILDTTFKTTNIQGPAQITNLWRNGQKGG